MTKLQINANTPDGADVLRRAGIDASAGGWFTAEYGSDNAVSAIEGLNPALIVTATRNPEGRALTPEASEALPLPPSGVNPERIVTHEKRRKQAEG